MSSCTDRTDTEPRQTDKRDRDRLIDRDREVETER